MEELAKLHYGEWMEWYDVGKVETRKRGDEIGEENVIEFKERGDQIPKSGLVQKGFYNPLELIDHPAGGTLTYVKFYRRRWYDVETKKEYYNTYDIRFPGTKLTKRFGIFLKSEDHGEMHEFLNRVPHLRDTIKEDMVVVQKSSLGVRKPWYKRRVTKRR